MRAPLPSRRPKAVRTTHYLRGLLAEYIATIYLWGKGYRILSHRFKTPVGEIDLIASRGKRLVMVEVKFRKDINDSFGAISPTSQQRIIKAAKWYMSQRSGQNYDSVQMDLIAIGRFSIKHLDNAWQDNP